MGAWAYILYVVAGIIAANGIPHFLKGITGEKHMTPFGESSSAVSNVLWGVLNFVVAIVILHYLAINNHHVIRESILFGVGALVISLILADAWSKKKA
ncbi:MAG TPA: hypothetical protein VMR34_00035 [Candidatus Saccharimonadales bacterium]|nr:hypothetical protein [Candidatus Saccharimonadales bacterium]